MSTYTYPEPLSQDEAVAKATEIYKESLDPEGLPEHAKVEICVWGEGPWGLRVASLDYWIPDLANPGCGGGASIMQSDAACIPTIFYAERYIITLMNPSVDGPHGVETAEAEYRNVLSGAFEFSFRWHPELDKQPGA